MKIRAKISYMALVKRCTISELFLFAILKCYKSMQVAEMIPQVSDEEDEKCRKLITGLTSSPDLTGFFKMIVLFNKGKKLHENDEHLKKY